MMASAPRSLACCIIRLNESSRVCSHNFVNSEMLPPTIVCSPAPIVPTMERERTTMPRTIPRLRLTRKPGSSNAVVTYSCGTMPASYPPVDLDDRRILLHDGLFQLVADAVASGAVDAALGLVAPHHQRPFLPEKQIGAAHGGEPRQAVGDAETLAQRNAEFAVHGAEF